MIPMTSVLFFISGIANGNANGSPYDVLGASLDLCGTTISILNCYPRNKMTKELFLVIIEALIVCRNGHKKMVFNATPSPRAM